MTRERMISLIVAGAAIRPWIGLLPLRGTLGLCKLYPRVRLLYAYFTCNLIAVRDNFPPSP